jgi:lambda repressor-like predicted transcriptional regulator
MSVTVRRAQLRQEMARRGWDAVDLAHAARLSPATISAALSGHPIAARSLTLIADALAHAPVVTAVDLLLESTDQPSGREID